MSAPSPDEVESRKPPRNLSDNFAMIAALMVLAATLTVGFPDRLVLAILVAISGVVLGVLAVKPARRPQFSLWNVLVVITVLSVCMAAWAAGSFGGLLVAIVVALVLGAVYGAVKLDREKISWPLFAVFGVSGLCAGGLLLPGVNSPSRSSPRSQCSSNLRMIGLALQEYHDAYGAYPPAYVADEEGKPMHSWRVLILPFMEYTSFYEQYDFSEPWDGPHNSRLAALFQPLVYSCPAATGAATGCTNYVAVVGPGTAWPGATSTSDRDFVDGAANTIMVVEVANSDIRWMEPRDFNLGHASRGVNPRIGRGISSPHKGCTVVALADGSTIIVPDSMSAKDLQAMLTIAGGERVSKPSP